MGRMRFAFRTSRSRFAEYRAEIRRRREAGEEAAGAGGGGGSPHGHPQAAGGLGGAPAAPGAQAEGGAGEEDHADGGDGEQAVRVGGEWNQPGEARRQRLGVQHAVEDDLGAVERGQAEQRGEGEGGQREGGGAAMAAQQMPEFFEQDREGAHPALGFVLAQ
ncbi:MAG TPA: hypothetical protein VIL86_10700, partial [Tepidisphaeraceae bacterium]